MSEMAFSRQFDCGFSFYTRCISSAIADFVFAFLAGVLVCESSGKPLLRSQHNRSKMRSI